MEARGYLREIGLLNQPLAIGSKIMESKIITLLLTLPLLLALSGAITAPTVSVRIVGPSSRRVNHLWVNQGQAAYVDFSDEQTEHVIVICTWSVVDTLDDFEIWMENGSRRRTILFTNSTHSYSKGRSRHILTAATFGSGIYGCAVRRTGRPVVNSRAFVYLSAPPKLVLTQREDVRVGGSAIFTCSVKDDFDHFAIDREIDYLFTNGSGTRHEMSSWTQGEWAVEGHKLTIANVQEWAKDVTVFCRVKGAKVRGSTSFVHNSRGWFFWSNGVAISFAATPPTSTPTPTSTPPTATGSDQLSDTLYIAVVFGSMVFLMTLAVLSVLVMLVVVLVRTGRTYGHGAGRRLSATPCLEQQDVHQAVFAIERIQYAYNGSEV